VITNRCPLYLNGNHFVILMAEAAFSFQKYIRNSTNLFMLEADEMEYEWEKDLKDYTLTENINNLKQIVAEKARKGRTIKWFLVIIDFLFVGLVFFFICVLNILKIKIDLIISVINGIIAFETAIIVFISPVRIISIKKDEVDRIVGKQVTGDIFKKISETIERNTSDVGKWFAIISACGILATVIFKVIS